MCDSVRPFKPYASHPERQVLNYLRAKGWTILAKLPVPAGNRLIRALEVKAWIELRGRGTEIRITSAGDDAVRSPVRYQGKGIASLLFDFVAARPDRFALLRRDYVRPGGDKSDPLKMPNIDRLLSSRELKPPETNRGGSSVRNRRW